MIAVLRIVAPLAALIAAALLVAPPSAYAQDARIRDLVISDEALPVRLLGYGLVTGLDGTGDRGIGTRSAGHTVQSVANLLRRFGVEVPAEILRTRNVAAVLVTAEVSPYLRPGGRFDLSVASLGDARSLRGGVLWMTPLVSDVGGEPVATAQGTVVMSEGSAGRSTYGPQSYPVETSARLPAGGLLEADLPRPVFASVSRLILREPDLGTASRIATAIDSALGQGTAVVEDPGQVTLTFAGDNADRAATLTKIRDLRVRPDRGARLVIDGRDGTVVAGGDMTVGDAVVSHGGITLTIGGSAADTPGNGGPGGLNVARGTTVQQVAAALHALQTTPSELAAIFASLREVGAISAEVTVR